MAYDVNKKVTAEDLEIALDRTREYVDGSIPKTLPADGGNAETANKLTTPRTINGVAFDGSEDIEIDAVTAKELADSSTAAVESANAYTDSVKSEITDSITETAADVLEQANAYADAADTALDTRVTANENAISTLNGTGEGSVTKTVTDKVAEIVANAPEDFDTLKEISDWISSHSESAAAMNSAINGNTAEIAEVKTELSEKADISDIPTSLPADGGNAETADKIKTALITPKSGINWVKIAEGAVYNTAGTLVARIFDSTVLNANNDIFGILQIVFGATNGTLLAAKINWESFSGDIKFEDFVLAYYRNTATNRYHFAVYANVTSTRAFGLMPLYNDTTLYNWVFNDNGVEEIPEEYTTRINSSPYPNTYVLNQIADLKAYIGYTIHQQAIIEDQITNTQLALCELAENMEV